MKVKGKWAHLYRAINKHGNTVDFYLSSTRNKKAAKRFLSKALKSIKQWAHLKTINTDKTPTYGPAIDELKEEGKRPEDAVHRQVKHRNDIVEAHHGKLNRLINPVRGFKSMKCLCNNQRVSTHAYVQKGTDGCMEI